MWPWINEHLQPVVRPVNFQTKHNPRHAVLCVVRCSTRTQCLCTARNAAVRGHAVMHCRQWSRGEPRRIRAVQRRSHLVDSEAGLEPKAQDAGGCIHPAGPQVDLLWMCMIQVTKQPTHGICDASLTAGISWEDIYDVHVIQNADAHLQGNDIRPLDGS